MTGSITRTTTAAAVGCATVATIAALAAPAAATGTRVGIDPGISFGLATNYGTGCSYAIDGIVDDPVTPVVFYDNSVPFAVANPSGSLAQAHWTRPPPDRTACRSGSATPAPRTSSPTSTSRWAPACPPVPAAPSPADGASRQRPPVEGGAATGRDRGAATAPCESGVAMRY
ncbi:hypothetical protein KHQ06_35555 [Nocardia tengchongensis]|uniref:Uncharacterized protein n=1 Tax=Nocardia tengchongensis TaxID=2055889 RepID=A0ABX8CNU8_9NOCA|nr:hypothetical protein [Nocardia tengchongensis]QVI21254.1 hypothetical protein KHQ06_35555 [Nocardia tengchongensis]